MDALVVKDLLVDFLLGEDVMQKHGSILDRRKKELRLRVKGADVVLHLEGMPVEVAPEIKATGVPMTGIVGEEKSAVKVTRKSSYEEKGAAPGQCSVEKVIEKSLGAEVKKLNDVRMKGVRRLLVQRRCLMQKMMNGRQLEVGQKDVGSQMKKLLVVLLVVMVPFGRR